MATIYYEDEIVETFETFEEAYDYALENYGDGEDEDSIDPSITIFDN